MSSGCTFPYTILCATDQCQDPQLGWLDIVLLFFPKPQHLNYKPRQQAGKHRGYF